MFPKIDGTNSSIWINDDGTLYCGSRTRTLSEEKDNRGFYTTFSNDKRFIDFFKKYPSYRLYGEYLVPHTLTTYRDNAWNRFYVFDVSIPLSDDNEETERLISYNDYVFLLQEFGIDYVPVQSIIQNPSEANLVNELEKNNYLVKDGAGVGEGIVIKNYKYQNSYGRQTWAKIVRSEFKEQNQKVFGTKIMKGDKRVEQEIVDSCLTSHVIEKCYQRVLEEKGGWKPQWIPMLLGYVWHDFVNEEIWSILKKWKNPIINFKVLNQLCVVKVKEIKKDLF